MGLTMNGYVRRSYDDILSDKIQRAKELFGEDIDTSDLTPLGKFIRINAYDQALAEEEIEAVYYARFPDTASGQNLDRLLVFGGIARNPAEPARYTISVQGTAGHAIEAGFLVGTDTGLTFYAVEGATIGSSGACTLTVECTIAGLIGNVNAGAINRIVNPDANITSVEGTARLVSGADEESDVSLRKRLKAAIAGAGSCNTNAIRSALLRVPTVTFADVVENDQDTTDSDGRPPHSFECYVVGGEDYTQEIAEKIFEKRPVGIQAVGDISKTIIDASGKTRSVSYSRPEAVNVLVHVKVETTTSFPTDGAEKIKANISGYISGLGIGKSLAYTSLYCCIYGVPGVADVSALELSTDGGRTYAEKNISVPKYGAAVCQNVFIGGEWSDPPLITAAQALGSGKVYLEWAVAVPPTYGFGVFEYTGGDSSFPYTWVCDVRGGPVSVTLENVAAGAHAYAIRPIDYVDSELTSGTFSKIVTVEVTA